MKESLDESHRRKKIAPSILILRRELRERHLLPACLLLLCLLLAGNWFFQQFTFSIDVQIDGASVGQVQTVEVMEEIVDAAQGTIGDILGEPFVIDQRVSYRFRLTRVDEVGQLDTNEVRYSIYEQIEEIDTLYVISIDGDTVGAVKEPETLQNALDERLLDAKEPDTVAAAFLADIAIEQQLTEADSTLGAGRIQELVETLPLETVVHVTSREVIFYEAEIVLDETLYVGDSYLLQEGANGEVEITTEVTYIDGLAVEHTVLETVILQESVPEIYVSGLLTERCTASFGEYIWPAIGSITSGFGPRRSTVGSSNHQGIDIGLRLNANIYAADGGEVIFAGWSGAFGRLIKLLHDNGHITYYAHNNYNLVTEGERVYRGQIIALAGTTGRSTGVHLHFELRIDGAPVNPIRHLPTDQLENHPAAAQ